MRGLDYGDLIARFEDQANTPDSERPTCYCEYCQQDRNARPCRLGGGAWCESGWHFRRVDSGFGYETDTAFERCPLMAVTATQKIRDEIHAREAEKARKMAAEAASAERIVRRAEEISKQLGGRP